MPVLLSDGLYTLESKGSTHIVKLASRILYEFMPLKQLVKTIKKYGIFVYYDGEILTLAKFINLSTKASSRAIDDAEEEKEGERDVGRENNRENARVSISERDSNDDKEDDSEEESNNRVRGLDRGGGRRRAGKGKGKRGRKQRTSGGSGGVQVV